MSSLFGKPKIPKMPAPAPPPPSPPKPEEGGEVSVTRRRKKGRAQTVMTGDLIPESIGKRTLLG